MRSAGSIQAEWLHTIGNLTLTGYNPELGNKDYSEKRIIFSLSHFDLNRFFGSCETHLRSFSSGRAVFA